MMSWHSHWILILPLSKSQSVASISLRFSSIPLASAARSLRSSAKSGSEGYQELDVIQLIQAQDETMNLLQAFLPSAFQETDDFGLRVGSTRMFTIPRMPPECNRLLRPHVRLGYEARDVDWTRGRHAPGIPAFPPRWHDSAG
jgi:hypothetical protein